MKLLSLHDANISIFSKLRYSIIYIIFLLFSFDGFSQSEIYSFNFNIQDKQWTEYSVSSNQYWHYSTSTDRLQGRNSVGMAINNYSGNSNSEDWLISPLLDFSSSSELNLSYWLNSKYAGSHLEILYSENYSVSKNPNEFTWHTLKTENELPTYWTESTLSLPSGKTDIHIAFKHTSGVGGGNSSALCIDDFTITGVQEALDGILNTSVENIVFPYIGANDFSQEKSFLLSFEKLKGNITISSTGDYQFSIDNTSYLSSLSILESKLSPIKINVRYAPKTNNLLITSSKIRIKAKGAFTQYISLSTQASTNISDANNIPKSETLDIVTWNLEWFGAPSKSKNATSFASQLDRVSAKIIGMDADIYAIQELVSDDLNGDFFSPLIERLNKLAGQQKYKGIMAPRYSHDQKEASLDFPAQRLCYIFDTNTVDDISNFSMFSDLYKGYSTTHIANYTGNASGFWSVGRLPYMLNADITINGTKENITLVNIHAKCCPNSYDRKLADAKFLYQELINNYDEDNIIILGDYNDFLSGSMSGGNESPYNIFFTSDEHFKPVFTSSSNIDHISISNELYDENDVLFNNTLETNVSISDHRPIMIRLKLNSVKPKLNIIGELYDFNYVDFSQGDFISQEQNFILNASSLTSDVNISLSAPFQISINNNVWSSELNITKEKANNIEIKVRFNPSEMYTNDISLPLYIRSENAQSIQLILKAKGKTDTKPPVFIGDTPRVKEMSSSGLSIYLQLNEASIVYYSALIKGEDAPSLSNILGGEMSISESFDAGVTVDEYLITGLDQNIEYDIYFIAKDKNTPIANTQNEYSFIQYVKKQSQLISFASIANKQLNSSPFELTATSDSGLEITYAINGPAILDGHFLIFTGLGTVEVIAQQEGNNKFLAAKEVIRTFVVSNITEIRPNETENEISVFPTPCKNFVYVQMSSSVKQNIYLINTKGEILFITKSSGKIKIPLNNYSKGVYFIKIGTNEKDTYKIIKQ